MSSASALATFNARAAAHRVGTFPDAILFGTIRLNAVATMARPGLTLQNGGYEVTAGNLLLRIPLTDLPAALIVKGTTVTVIATAQRFAVKEKLAQLGGPQVAEHIIDCVPL